MPYFSFLKMNKLQKSLLINLRIKNQYINYFLFFKKFFNNQAEYKIFDRTAKLKQRNRILRLENHSVYDYIKKEFGYRLSDRLYDIKREFDILVELNCGKGYLTPHLTKFLAKKIFLCDSSIEMLNVTKLPSKDIQFEKLLVDEEQIPFKNNSIDIFVSNLSLHWVNYLQSTFKKILDCLKNDGIFIGCLFGGQTLYELRCSLQLAQIERESGISPHISPFVEASDLGLLLQKSGFNMLTIDIDEIIINYPNIIELMYDLQGMGENNAILNRKCHLKRDTILASYSIYKEMYGNKDETLPATYQVFHFIGWKPDKSQPKPAERASGEFSFQDIAGLDKMILKKNVNSK